MFPCRCSLRYSADAGRARGPKAIYAGISPDTLCGAMRRIGEPPAEGTRTVSPSSGSSSLSDEHSTQEAKFKASFLRFISLSISRPAGRDQRLCLWKPRPFQKGRRKFLFFCFSQHNSRAILFDRPAVFSFFAVIHRNRAFKRRQMQHPLHNHPAAEVHRAIRPFLRHQHRPLLPGAVNRAQHP